MLGVKSGMAHSIIVDKTCRWQVKLCDPSLIRATQESFRDDHYPSSVLQILQAFYLQAFIVVLAAGSVLSVRVSSVGQKRPLFKAWERNKVEKGGKMGDRGNRQD